MRFVQMKNYSKKVNFLLRKKISLLIEPVYFFYNFSSKHLMVGMRRKEPIMEIIYLYFLHSPVYLASTFSLKSPSGWQIRTTPTRPMVPATIVRMWGFNFSNTDSKIKQQAKAAKKLTVVVSPMVI